MMIQGKSCTLTVAKDGYFYPLPYSEETVRTASKGYALPGVIGERNREINVITGKTIEGCFVTRLEYQCVLALFLLLFNNNETFDLYADRVCKNLIYKNVLPRAFELRAENGNPFYFRLDVKDSEDSFTENWPLNVPDMKWPSCRTYYYDGHSVIADLQTLPLVYRFELRGSFTEKTKFEITLYFPLTEKFYPSLDKIEKLSIVIDLKDGVCLDLYDMRPCGSLTDINCADTVLCYQKFVVESHIVFNIRNSEQNTQVVL